MHQITASMSENTTLIEDAPNAIYNGIEIDHLIWKPR
jgi:hypothetical protein